MALTEETRVDMAPGELLGLEWRADRSALYGNGVAAIPGVHPYKNASGETVLELVDDAVLADPDYLASVARSPITLEHPPEMVTPDNATQYVVGDADGEAEIDDRGYIRIKIAARTRAATDAMESGKKAGLSMGYPVTIDDTPGVHPKYGRYDRRQVKRGPNNHIAICSSPRHGDRCSIRVDAYEVPTMTPKTAAMLAALALHFKRDSISEEELPALVENLMADVAALRGEVSSGAVAHKAELDAIKAQLSGAKEQIAATEEEAAKTDAAAVAKTHAVTLAATDSAGMRRELVKAVLNTDATDTTLPGLYAAVKALPANGERLKVEPRGDGAHAVRTQTAFTDRYAL